MIHDISKSPDSSKLKSLSQQWSNLIKQFKSQSKQKVNLPPIIFKRKSPLQNYKNAIKLHESLNKKKSITQKILDLSKNKKISTININQTIKQHKRFNSSDNVYTLTDEEKELLNSRRFHDHNNKLNQTHREKKVNTKQIIKHIKAYHDENVAKQREKNSYRQYKKHNINNSYNNKREKSKTILTHHNQQQQNSTIKLNLIDYSNLQLTNNNHNQQQLKSDKITFKSQQPHIIQNSQQQQDEQNQNQKLSFQLSKDYKSLRYRYDKQQHSSNNISNDRFDDSIAKMLIKNRRQKVQHIFSIFSTTKNQHYQYTEDKLTQSQRVLKPYSQTDLQEKQRLSQIQLIDHNMSINSNNNKSVFISQINNSNNNSINKSILISQQNPIINNKSSITSKNTSPQRTKKHSIFSPINRKRQRNYIKKYNNPIDNELKINIIRNSQGIGNRYYQPWDDDMGKQSMHNQSIDIDFTIENYYNNVNGQQLQGIRSHLQQQQQQQQQIAPKSKTVIIL